MNVNNYTLTPVTVQIIVIPLKAEALTSEQVLTVSGHREKGRENVEHAGAGGGRVGVTPRGH